MFENINDLKSEINNLQNKVDELARVNKRLKAEAYTERTEKRQLQNRLDTTNILNENSPVKKIYDFQEKELVKMHLMNGKVMEVFIGADDLNEFLNAVLKAKINAVVMMKIFTLQNSITGMKDEVILFSSDVVGIELNKEIER